MAVCGKKNTGDSSCFDYSRALSVVNLCTNHPAFKSNKLYKILYEILSLG